MGLSPEAIEAAQAEHLQQEHEKGLRAAKEAVAALHLENVRITAFAIVDLQIKKVLSKKLSRGAIQNILPDLIAAAKEVLA